MMNNTPSSDLDLIRQEIFRIGAKMDAFPQTYVTRIEYVPWTQSVEKRLDGHEKWVSDYEKQRQLDWQWAGDERMKINQVITETERRLSEKQDNILTKMETQDEKRDLAIKETQKEAQGFKVLILLNLLAWIAVPALFLVINYLLSHPH